MVVRGVLALVLCVSVACLLFHVSEARRHHHRHHHHRADSKADFEAFVAAVSTPPTRDQEDAIMAALSDSAKYAEAEKAFLAGLSANGDDGKATAKLDALALIPDWAATLIDNKEVAQAVVAWGNLLNKAFDFAGKQQDGDETPINEEVIAFAESAETRTQVILDKFLGIADSKTLTDNEALYEPEEEEGKGTRRGDVDEEQSSSLEALPSVEVLLQLNAKSSSSSIALRRKVRWRYVFTTVCATIGGVVGVSISGTGLGIVLALAAGGLQLYMTQPTLDCNNMDQAYGANVLHSRTRMAALYGNPLEANGNNFENYPDTPQTRYRLGPRGHQTKTVNIKARKNDPDNLIEHNFEQGKVTTVGVYVIRTRAMPAERQNMPQLSYHIDVVGSSHFNKRTQLYVPTPHQNWKYTEDVNQQQQINANGEVVAVPDDDTLWPQWTLYPC